MRLDRPESLRKGQSLRGIFTFMSSLSFFVKLLSFWRVQNQFFFFTRLPGPDVLLELKKKIISSLDQGIKDLFPPKLLPSKKHLQE